jgi:arylsulfatase
MRSTLLLAIASLTLASAAEPPLNVVVLVSDDHRWDSLGAAGNPTIRTPRLDALAGEGIRFSEARVTTSICMVSRASILTGQMMSRHGIDAFGKAIAPEAFSHTYPALLRASGYWSGFVGKYGIGAIRPGDFDFSRQYETKHWFETETGEPIHVTEKNARDALDFLRTRPKDKPFVLSVCFFAAHAEDRAPEQYLPQAWSAAAYEGVTIPRSPLATEEYLQALPSFLSAPANEGRIRWGWRFDTPERYQTYMTKYYRLITELDQAVGRIVDELKAQGVYERTLIVFIGDNGYFHADRGLADKWYPYEQALRVPFLVRDPRLPTARRGLVREESVLNIDVAPTIIAAAGLDLPAGVQGRDVSPLYLGPGLPDWREEFFYEHPTITSRDRIPTSWAVVRKDVKYIYWPEFEYEQLFDLTRDPTELRNLSGDPTEAARQSELRLHLTRLRERAR